MHLFYYKSWILPILFFAFITMYSLCGHAQNKIAFSIDAGQMHSGKNIRIGVLYNAGKPQLKFGVKYHLNNANDYDSRNYAFMYRLNASKFGEHFGLYGGVNIPIISGKGRSYSLYATIDAEYGRMGIKSFWFEALGGSQYGTPEVYDSSGFRMFRRHTFQVKHASHAQLSLGLSFRNKVSDRLNIMIDAGTGPAAVWFSNQSFIDTYNSNRVSVPGGGFIFDSIFSPYLRLGFGLSIGKLSDS
jgi:hypothetical protein